MCKNILVCFSIMTLGIQAMDQPEPSNMKDDNSIKKSNIIIRDVQDKDIERSIELIAQLGYTFPKEYIEAFLPHFKKKEIDHIAIAEDTSTHKVIGLAHVHFRDFSKRCTLEAIVVDSQCRGKGVGALLLLAAEKFSKQKGAQVLEFISSNDRKDTAHKFYATMGYNDGEKAYFQKKLQK